MPSEPQPLPKQMHLLGLIMVLPDLFLFIFVFSNNHFNFYNKYRYVKKCPSSIWCWDSNPCASEHEPSPITTRPGLPQSIVCCCFVTQKIIFFLAPNTFSSQKLSITNHVFATSGFKTNSSRFNVQCYKHVLEEITIVKKLKKVWFDAYSKFCTYKYVKLR